MRLPWRRKNRKNTEADRAVELSREQKETVSQQREVVNEVVEAHRRLLAPNHIAEAMRKALQEPR